MVAKHKPPKGSDNSGMAAVVAVLVVLLLITAVVWLTQ